MPAPFQSDSSSPDVSGFVLRPAGPEDLPAINRIYNHYVLTSTSTWQTVPETEEARKQWFEQRDPDRHPVRVMESDGIIAAWSSLSAFGKREAFARTVENSIYVHPEFQSRGMGRRLLQDQIQQAQKAGHHIIIAAISADQQPSLRLHRSAGFEDAGCLKQAGWKFGEWLDLRYLQKTLP